MNIEQAIPSLELDRAAATPLYRQAYQKLRQLILQGTLPPGSRLPPSRLLARREKVGRVTIMQAYEQLVMEGFVISRTGSGTYVAAGISTVQSAPPQPPDAPHLTEWGQRVLAYDAANTRGRARPELDFGFGRSFSHIFPYDVWRRLLARYLSTDDIMLSRYGSIAGFNPLRQAVASYLAASAAFIARPIRS